MFGSNKLAMLAAAMLSAAAFAACENIDFLPDGDDGSDEGETPSTEVEVVLDKNGYLRGNDVNAAGKFVAFEGAIYEVNADGGVNIWFVADESIASAIDADEALASGKVFLLQTEDGLANFNYKVGDGVNIEEGSYADNKYDNAELDFAVNGNGTFRIDIAFLYEDEALAADNLRMHYNGPVSPAGYPALGTNACSTGKELPLALTEGTELRKAGKAWTWTLTGEEATVVVTVPEEIVHYGAYNNDYAVDFASSGAVILFNGEPIEGTGYIGVTSSTDNTGTLKSDLRADVEGDSRFRLHWSNGVYAEYESGDYYVHGSEEGELLKIYTWADDMRTYFVYGNGASESVKDLRRDGEKGAWAVMFSVPTRDLEEGGEFTFTDSASHALANVSFFDYENYETKMISSDAYLSLYNEPNRDGEKLYVRFAMTVNDTKHESEFYGVISKAVLNDGEVLAAVLTPEKPADTGTLKGYSYSQRTFWSGNLFVPLDEPKTVTRKVGRMEVAKIDSFVINNVKQEGNYYLFYFSLVVGNYVDIDSTIYTPLLAVHEDYLGQRIEIPDFEDGKHSWMFNYTNNSALYQSSYSYILNNPSKGWVEVTQNEDKTFDYSVCIYDYVESNYSHGQESTVLLEGKNVRASLYSGANTARREANQLTEDDLQ